MHHFTLPRASFFIPLSVLGGEPNLHSWSGTMNNAAQPPMIVIFRVPSGISSCEFKLLISMMLYLLMQCVGIIPSVKMYSIGSWQCKPSE